MENYLPSIKKCPLFAGIEEKQLRTLLDCLAASQKHYPKNSFVFRAGEAVTAIGIVLSGSVHIIQEDFWGNRVILANIENGGLFGEAFSSAEIEQLPVSVLAVQSADILLVDYRRIITNCSSACVFHAQLIKNMLRILAGKNIMLTQKMELLSRRRTRDKLLAYLSAQALRAGNNTFVIPFNRQELAEYLAVDRSAMSSELAKMQQEGVLIFHRNQFTLLQP